MLFEGCKFLKLARNLATLRAWKTSFEQREFFLSPHIFLPELSFLVCKCHEQFMGVIYKLPYDTCYIHNTYIIHDCPPSQSRYISVSRRTLKHSRSWGWVSRLHDADTWGMLNRSAEEVRASLLIQWGPTGCNLEFDPFSGTGIVIWGIFISTLKHFNLQKEHLSLRILRIRWALDMCIGPIARTERHIQADLLPVTS